jgi:hypothetical protein
MSRFASSRAACSTFTDARTTGSPGLPRRTV